jgi:hypothetical protein
LKIGSFDITEPNPFRWSSRPTIGSALRGAWSDPVCFSLPHLFRELSDGVHETEAAIAARRQAAAAGRGDIRAERIIALIHTIDLRQTVLSYPPSALYASELDVPRLLAPCEFAIVADRDC